MNTFVPDPIYAIPPDEWLAHLDGEGRWDPQCTAITKRGTQCLHRLFGGQVYWFSNTDGDPYIKQADADRLHAGICPFHRKLEAK